MTSAGLWIDAWLGGGATRVDRKAYVSLQQGLVMCLGCFRCSSEVPEGCLLLGHDILALFIDEADIRLQSPLDRVEGHTSVLPATVKKVALLPYFLAGEHARRVCCT